MSHSCVFIERCSELDFLIIENCFDENILEIEQFIGLQDTLNPELYLYKSFQLDEDQLIEMKEPIFGEEIISRIDLSLPLEKVSWCEIDYCFSHIYNSNGSIIGRYTTSRASSIALGPDSIRTIIYNYDSSNRLVSAEIKRPGEYCLSLFRYKNGRISNEKVYISESPISHNLLLRLKKPNMEFKFVYNYLDDLEKVHYGIHHTWSAVFDPQGKLLKEILLVDGVESNSLQYTYDVEGRIKSVVARAASHLSENRFVYYQFRYRM